MSSELENEEETGIEKRRIAITLDAKLVDELDDYIHQKKKTLPVCLKNKLNRTVIIALIIEGILNDYHKKNENSNLELLFSFWKDLYLTEDI